MYIYIYIYIYTCFDNHNNKNCIIIISVIITITISSRLPTHLNNSRLEPLETLLWKLSASYTSNQFEKDSPLEDSPL